MDEDGHTEQPQRNRYHQSAATECLAHQTHVATTDPAGDPGEEEDQCDQGDGDQGEGEQLALMLGPQFDLEGWLFARRCTRRRPSLAGGPPPSSARLVSAP